MAGLKTTRNDADVDEFLNSVGNERRRRDALEMRDLMAGLAGEKPEMWGASIVGYGAYRYTSKAGDEHEWFKVGFSPRRQALTLYIMDGFDEYEALLGKLGDHSTGKSCLYIKDLEQIDLDALSEMITRSLENIEARSTATD